MHHQLIRMWIWGWPEKTLYTSTLLFCSCGGSVILDCLSSVRENWRVEYSYPCFHMCMQKYYYGYQLRERKVYCTCCKYACFESSSVMCTYRIDKSYKHDHYQLLSSSAGQRRDKMEIHLPPHQGVCPTQRYGTGCHGYQPLWITPLPTVIVS